MTHPPGRSRVRLGLGVDAALDGFQSLRDARRGILPVTARALALEALKQAPFRLGGALAEIGVRVFLAFSPARAWGLGMRVQVSDVVDEGADVAARHRGFLRSAVVAASPIRFRERSSETRRRYRTPSMELTKVVSITDAKSRSSLGHWALRMLGERGGELVARDIEGSSQPADSGGHAQPRAADTLRRLCETSRDRRRRETLRHAISIAPSAARGRRTNSSEPRRVPSDEGCVSPHWRHSLRERAIGSIDGFEMKMQSAVGRSLTTSRPWWTGELPSSFCRNTLPVKAYLQDPYKIVPSNF